MSSKNFTSPKINPHKTSWDTDDWIIYTNNLELLCSLHGLKKKDFSRQVGLANAFRTDAGRPSMETIKKISEIFNKSPEWLLTYHDKLTSDVNEPEKSYDPHGGWTPRSLEDLTGLAPGYKEAFLLLLEIFESKNNLYKRAIYANLQAFSGAIKNEARMRSLEERDAERGRELAELRALIKNHAKAHAYYGEDRRSGIERRQIEGVGPAGIERRSGEDRRKTE